MFKEGARPGPRTTLGGMLEGGKAAPGTEPGPGAGANFGHAA